MTPTETPEPGPYADQVFLAALPEILTVDDAARALHCTSRHVLLLISKRQLAARRVAKRWLVRREDLLDALAPETAICADCAKSIALGAGMVGASGLMVCDVCATRLRGAGGRS